ncbi:NAD(P)-binding protein [Mycena alexandri]|uniref:NAD(P)-binding protein n=1 Tax=Mycena alexandri TaxID=1745969 RepID=A0AAD6TCT4_9AGAR|nr:NAD(P)-binding protein [Mycena alexandri]
MMSAPTVPACPRVWFITGASSGFGLLMAQKALGNGEKVVATLRKPEVLSDLRSHYTEKQLLVCKVDVTKSEDILAAFAATEKTFGRIDVVFNNAGYGIVGEVEGTDEEKARNQFETNFWGGLTVTKEAIRVFRDFNNPVGGKLFVMSSMFGIDAPPGAGFYPATKFGTVSSAVTIQKLTRFTSHGGGYRLTGQRTGPGMEHQNRGPLPWLVQDNAVVEPVHPAYAHNENLGSMQVRKLMVDLVRGDSPALQDATKLINKFWDLSNVENPPIVLHSARMPRVPLRRNGPP